tara:strand:- start:6 stop:371 length:366 start_codon:yes stop_codon:yes gene_type:complete
MELKYKEKKLSISTFKVEVQAIRVDGKAMTISLFNQITHVRMEDFLPIDDLLILGVVKRTTKKEHLYWTLFSWNNQLFKSIKHSRYCQFTKSKEERLIREKKTTKEELRIIDFAKQIYIAV